MSFRQSHGLVGQVVRRAEELGVSLQEVPLAEYQAIHPAFAEDVYQVFDFAQSVAARSVTGGTAPAAVRAQIQKAKSKMTNVQ